MELFIDERKDILPDSVVRKDMQDRLLICIAQSTYSQTKPTSFLKIIPGKYFIPQYQPDKASNFLGKCVGPQI